MVVKLDVLDQGNSSLKLSKLDLSDFENLPCELMKLPTATTSSWSADLSNAKNWSFLRNIY